MLKFVHGIGSKRNKIFAVAVVGLIFVVVTGHEVPQMNFEACSIQLPSPITKKLITYNCHLIVVLDNGYSNYCIILHKALMM